MQIKYRRCSMLDNGRPYKDSHYQSVIDYITRIAP